MQEFGQFEVVREVATEQNTIVYLAQKKGGPQNKLFAIKLFPSHDGSELPDHGESSAGPSEETFQREILKAITSQKKAAERAPRHIAPVFDFGADARGVWYVTEYFPQGPLKKRISHGSAINAAELQYIVESVLAGLVAFKKRCGRSHGNLHAGNIFLSGEPGTPLQRMRVLLDHPCRGSEVHAGQFELDDIGALGQIIYQLVCQPEVGGFGEVIFPIFSSESWTKLGKDGEDWRELCNELLDPALSLDTTNLRKLAAQLRAKKRGVARVLSGAVIVLVCAIGLFAWRDGRKNSPQTEVLFKAAPVDDSAIANKPAQTAPSEKKPAPQIINAKAAMAEVGNGPPSISDIEDQTTEQNKSIQLTFTVGDKETPARDLIVTKISSDPALVPLRNIVIGRSDASGVLRITPAANQSGSSRITLVVTDGLLRATNSFLLTVKASNTPPMISSITDQTTEQNKPVRPIAFHLSDEQTDAGNVEVVGQSLTPALLPTSSLRIRGTGADRALVIDPAPAQPGEAKLALVASDGSLRVTNTFRLTVRPMNTPPVISRIEDQTVAQDKSVELAFSLKDKETAPEKLRVTKRSSNPFLIPESSIELAARGTNGRVRISPAKEQTGESTIRLTVSDGDAETSTDFVVRVNPANKPPTISDIEDQTTEQNKTIELTFTLGDKETPARDLIVTKISSDPSLVPERNIVIGRSDASGVLRITPAANQSGSSRITLVASDGSLSATNSFLLTVKVRNTPPTISSISNQTTEQNKPVRPIAFHLSDEQTDAGNVEVVGQSLTPALLPTSSLKIRGAGADRALVIDPAPAQAGEAQLALVASDGSLRVTNTFRLTVGPMNTPPVISPIEDQTIAQDKSVELAFSLKDKETAPERLSVTKRSSNPFLIPDSSIELAARGTNGRVRISPAKGQTGESTIRLTVSDGDAETSTDFVARVTPGNTPPTISGIEDQTTEQNKTIELTFTVGDKETPARDLILTKISSDPSLVPERNILIGRSDASGVLRITPTANQSGSSRITLVASDGSLSATNSFLLTVKVRNTPPTISSITDQTTEQNKPVSPIAFHLSDEQTDAGNVEVVGQSLTPALLPTSSLRIRGTGADRALVIDPAPSQPGEAQLALVAHDGSLRVTNTFRLTVRPMNTPPVISPIEDQTIAQDKSVELAFSLKDKETAPERLSVTKRSSNPFLIPESSIELAARGTNGRVRISPAKGQTGESTIRLTVSDGDAETSTDFVVRVTPGNTPPTISGIEDQTTEQNKTIELTFTVGDKETPARDLILTKISSDPSLVPERNILIGRSGAAGALRIAPTANQSGASRITLIASDGSLRTTNSFLLTVKAADIRSSLPTPAGQITDQSKPIGPIAVTDEAKDPGRAELAGESLKTTPPPASSLKPRSTDGDRALVIDPAPAQTNEARIELLATDGALIATNTFLLPIRSKNAPPIISRIKDQTTEQDKPVELAFSVSDKETPVRRLSITKSSSNPLLVPEKNIVLSGSGERRTLRIIPEDKQTGTAEITVSVNDGSTPVRTSFQLEVTPRRQSAAVSTMTNSIGMEFVKVGPYWIAKYEVTALEYEQLSPLDSAGLKGKHEPAHVTWNDAMTFCGQLTFAELEAKSLLGKGWIYTLLTTNEWKAIMADENFASLAVHRKAGANTPESVREWSFSAGEDLRAPASMIGFNLEGDRIKIDEFGEDEKDAVHTFRCVLVPRGELLASQTVTAQPQKRRKREAPKMSGWEELLRTRAQKKL